MVPGMTERERRPSRARDGRQPPCFEDYCRCLGSDVECSCPAGDAVCDSGGCCLATDACVAPIECFDGGVCRCHTQTCGTGNDMCHNEFAFCGSGTLGTCGCFTLSDGSHLCALLPDGRYCPGEGSECDRNGEGCATGDVCADITCCNPSLQCIGRRVTPCS